MDVLELPLSGAACPRDQLAEIRREDLLAILKPVQSAGPALFMALMRCLEVLETGDVGEARVAAISEAKNALLLRSPR